MSIISSVYSEGLYFLATADKYFFNLIKSFFRLQKHIVMLDDDAMLRFGFFSRKTRSVMVPRFGFFPGFTGKG